MQYSKNKRNLQKLKTQCISAVSLTVACFKTTTTLICVFSHTVHQSTPLVIPFNTSGRSNLPLQAAALSVGERGRKNTVQQRRAMCHRQSRTPWKRQYSMCHCLLRNDWKLHCVHQRVCIPHPPKEHAGFQFPDPGPRPSCAIKAGHGKGGTAFG